MSGKSDVEVTISELARAFPTAFPLDPTTVRPLKLGIKDDIYARSDISHRRITAALRLYCNGASYLAASKEGAVRIDLSGQPAGTVTEAEAKHAFEALTVLAKIATKRSRKAISGSTPPSRNTGAAKPSPRAAVAVPKRSNIITKGRSTSGPAAVGPRRLSLDDLRKAAATRKKSDPR